MLAVKDFISDLKGDRVIWMIIIFLAIASILSVYSSIGSMAYKLRDGNTEYYLLTHVLYMGIGFFMMMVCSRIHYTKFAKLAPILFVIAVPLLLYTLFFGAEVNDAKRWIVIPWIDKTFQPSDFAKLALIIFLARALSKRQENIKDFKQSFLPIIIPVGIICTLIAPADLSTACLLFVTCILMMIIGRVSLKYIFSMAIIGIILLSLLVLLGTFFPDFVRVETWVSRIQEFLYNTDGGYQIQQSKIAIASGEFFGRGPGNSLQRNYLPYPYADFIYAIICEEYGLIGAFFIIGLYLWLLFRCIAIVTRCPKTFGAILAMGLALNIVIQAFANIAVSVHMVPVTGLTLPFISMGGTSLIFTCIALGIILSVSRYVDDSKRAEKKVLESSMA